MRSKPHSWRLSVELKSELKRKACLLNISVSSILDLAVREWLEKNGMDEVENEGQRELHKAAARCIGALARRHARRADTAREAIRRRLTRRRTQ